MNIKDMVVQLDSLYEVGVKKIQHDCAVLPSVEGHTDLLELVLLVGSFEYGESVADLGTEGGREERGHSRRYLRQEPPYLLPGGTANLKSMGLEL